MVNKSTVAQHTSNSTIFIHLLRQVSLIVVAVFLGFFELTGVCLAASSVGQQNEILIHIDLDSNIGHVNRRVLGNNALAYLNDNPLYSAQGAGLWNPSTRQSNTEMVRLAREAGVSMLRWPGGCGVHEYNWKLTVGALADRPKQAFGLPEFMKVAEEIGATPVITIADFWGDASDAANLVEYLNAPVGVNPNGGVDWAEVRAKDGHVKPYGVVWFEYGNETYHGPHTMKWEPTGGSGFSAEQYAQRYLEFRVAMRAVDSNIKLGAVIATAALSSAQSNWSNVIIRDTGGVADFFIYHAYGVSYGRNDGIPIPEDLFRIVFAAPKQLEIRLDALSKDIVAITGRSIPVAVTEYNGSFVQEKPTPYRFSLGTAILVADMVQAMLRPASNVVHAQYWQYSNEYWGMVKGYKAPFTVRPAFHVFKMYQEHLGDYLLRASVHGESYEEQGGYGVLPARGEGSLFELMGTPQPVTAKWKNSLVLGADADVDSEGVLNVRLKEYKSVNYHHSKIVLPAEPSRGYRVSAEIRTDGLTPIGAKLQVGDGRGWVETKSVAYSDDVTSDKWTTVMADYVTLPDTKSIEIVARRHEHAPETGMFSIKNVRIQSFKSEVLPKIPYVGVLATKKDNVVSLFLVNRRIGKSSFVRVVIPRYAKSHGWVLSGPTVEATNESELSNVSIRDLQIESIRKGARVELPPNSFTVLEFSLIGKGVTLRAARDKNSIQNKSLGNK